MVGIDHGFSFSCTNSKRTGVDGLAVLPRRFGAPLPTDEDHGYVDFVRHGFAGGGAARMRNANWRRLNEERAAGASSSFISMSRARSPNPLKPGSPGCGLSASSLAPASISGRSTGGTFRPDVRPSRRSISNYGRAASPGRAAPAISTTPSASPLGCRTPIATAALEHSLILSCRRRNAH